MVFNLIRGSEGDVDASAVGLPTGNGRGESEVGVCDAAVVLCLELVLRRVGRGVGAARIE